MSRSPRVLTVGEALVDWVSLERGADLERAGSFTKAPGGAPMNVAVGLARLGTPVAFAGCVGADPFGYWLGERMQAEGVATDWLRVVPNRQTRMAYVVTNEAGDRELAGFSTVGVADTALDQEQLPADLLESVKAYYFGSLILTASPAREAVLQAAERVRAAGGLSVFDPNVRPVLWSESRALHTALDVALDRTDLLKLGDDELLMLTGEENLSRGAAVLLSRYDLAAVVVTCGADGAYVCTPMSEAWADGFAVDAVETTGAGDGFVAGLLAGLTALERGEAPRMAGLIKRLPASAWERLLREANAVGAIATTRPGASAALPTREELSAFLAGAAG